MKKLLSALLALVLSLGMCGTAMAATSLTKYVLIVNGDAVALDSSTGWLGKSGSRLTIPVAKVCSALGLSPTQNDAHTRLSVTTAEGKTVEVASGYKFLRVDGKKVSMRSKAYRKDGVLMADAGLIAYLGFGWKHVKASSETKDAGYASGVLLVGDAGDDLTLPSGEEESFAASLDAAKSCDQMVVVQYEGDSKATLTFHQKDENGTWRQELSASAYVGRNGIGKAKEGDGKTPTGTYNLTQAFGIKADPGTALPYVKVTKYHYWCGTSSSEYYNQLIDTRVVSRARTSSDEYLIKYAGAYNYAVFIDYNADGVAGKGSCIFLHCSTGKATAGCVSVPEATMVKLLKMLKPGAKIVIGKQIT